MKTIPPIPDWCCTVSFLPNTYTKVNFYTVLTMLLNKFSQPRFQQTGVKNSTLRHKMSQYRNVQYVWQRTVQMLLLHSLPQLVSPTQHAHTYTHTPFDIQTPPKHTKTLS